MPISCNIMFSVTITNYNIHLTDRVSKSDYTESYSQIIRVYHLGGIHHVDFNAAAWFTNSRLCIVILIPC